MNRFLKCIFSLLLLLAYTEASYSAHIIGGQMSYDVISHTGNNFEVEIEIEIYRDNLGGGAQFDSSLLIGLFRKVSNNSYQYVSSKNVIIAGVETIPIDFNDCELSLSESQRGFYNTRFDIPDDGNDYMVAYQRCCRTNNIINIENPGDSGLALSVLITNEAIIGMNKSHKILNSSDRFIKANEPNSIFIELESDNDVVSQFVIPFTAGGTDGSGTNGGDQNSCTGVTPDPAICPPPFAKVTLQSNINDESLFFDSDDFSKISELEYQVTATAEGNYLISYFIHEYKDSILMSSHYREQVYIVSNCNIVLNDKDMNLGNSVELYPNPVNHLLYIDSKEEMKNVELTILDINGLEVQSLQSSELNPIDVSMLLPGIYLVRIKNNQGIELQKFIKS